MNSFHLRYKISFPFDPSCQNRNHAHKISHSLMGQFPRSLTSTFMFLCQLKVVDPVACLLAPYSGQINVHKLDLAVLQQNTTRSKVVCGSSSSICFGSSDRSSQGHLLYGIHSFPHHFCVCMSTVWSFKRCSVKLNQEDHLNVHTITIFFTPLLLISWR